MGALEGGSPDQGERRERLSASVSVHAGHRALHKNTSPKQEGLIITSFYKQWSSKSEIVEVCAITGVEPGRYRGGLWRTAEAQEWTAWSKGPLGCTGRPFPFLECIWETWHCLSRDKRADGHH